MEKGSKNTCSSVISAKPEGTEAQRREMCNMGGFGSTGRHLGVPVLNQGHAGEDVASRMCRRRELMEEEAPGMDQAEVHCAQR